MEQNKFQFNWPTIQLSNNSSEIKKKNIDQGLSCVL